MERNITWKTRRVSKCVSNIAIMMIFQSLLVRWKSAHLSNPIVHGYDETITVVLYYPLVLPHVHLYYSLVLPHVHLYYSLVLPHGLSDGFYILPALFMFGLQLLLGTWE